MLKRGNMGYRQHYFWNYNELYFNLLSMSRGMSPLEKLALKGQNSAKLTSAAQKVKNLLKSLVVLG